MEAVAQTFQHTTQVQMQKWSYVHRAQECCIQEGNWYVISQMLLNITKGRETLKDIYQEFLIIT